MNKITFCKQYLEIEILWNYKQIDLNFKQIYILKYSSKTTYKIKTNYNQQNIRNYQ